MPTENLKKLFVLLMLLACLLGYVRPELALIFGVVVSFLKSTALQVSLVKYSSLVLKIAVVLLGAGLPVQTIIKTGGESFLPTMISITLTIGAGLLLAKAIGLSQIPALLLSVGTAICGGSAIAAVAPVIKANDKDVSFSLIVVFLLNAAALLIFPTLGTWAELTEVEFGLWAALAIHDTSSVVGAAAVFGDQALQVATTTKLVRALWIIPVVLVISFFYRNSGSKKKLEFPWFILGFLILAMLFDKFLFLKEYAESVYSFGKNLLVASLFLIGCNSRLSEFNKQNFKALTLGLSLWLIVSVFSFLFVLAD